MAPVPPSSAYVMPDPPWPSITNKSKRISLATPAQPGFCSST